MAETCELYEKDRGCVKCGGKKINDIYHKDYLRCSSWICHTRFEGEHIHRSCVNCGYEWAELPLTITL